MNDDDPDSLLREEAMVELEFRRRLRNELFELSSDEGLTGEGLNERIQALAALARRWYRRR